jgi:hypothetical protein
VHNPVEDFKDKLEVKQEVEERTASIAMTDERCLAQVAILDELEKKLGLENAKLLGMLQMVAPPGVVGFNRETSTFTVRMANEVVEDTVAGAEEVDELGTSPVDSDKQDGAAGDK